MHRDTIAKALENEQSFMDARQRRPGITHQFQQQVRKLVMGLHQDVRQRFRESDQWLQEFVGQAMLGRVVPMSVTLKDGRLQEVVFCRQNDVAMDDSAPWFALHHDGQRASLRRFDRHPSGMSAVLRRPLIDRLFASLSEVMIVSMQPGTPTYHHSLLRDSPITALAELLATGSAREQGWIARNIDCYAAIKATTGPAAREAQAWFDCHIEQLMSQPGPLLAQDLIGLYDWTRQGELARAPWQQQVVAQLSHQLADRLSPEEQDKYRRFEAILTVMTSPGSAHHAYLKYRHQCSLADLAELHECLGFTGRDSDETRQRRVHYREWMETVKGATAIGWWLAAQPAMTPVELLQCLYRSELVRPLPSDRFALQRLLALVDDPTLRDQTQDVAHHHSAILSALHRQPLDMLELARRQLALNAEQRQSQRALLASLADPRWLARYRCYERGDRFNDLLVDGVLPGIAARMAGITAQDVVSLGHAFPVLHQLRLAMPERVMDR